MTETTARKSDRQPAKPRKPGRPTKFSQAMADRICTLIASGVPLTEIVRQNGMPALATVYRWLKDRADFRELYARAREDMAHTLVAQILEIADDSRNDWVERNGDWLVDNEAVQRSKLRVDTRKWAASKLLPKIYGDRILTELGNPTGEDGRQQPFAANLVVEKIAAALAALRAKLAEGKKEPEAA